MDGVEDRVLRLFDQFTSLEDRETTSLAPEVLRVAKLRVGEEIASLLSDETTSELFLSKTDAAVSFESDMDLVASLHVLGDAELSEARDNIPKDAKMGKVALRFLTSEPEASPKPTPAPAPAASARATETGPTQDVKLELPQLFRGDVQSVSERLVGKQLRHQDATILVASTLPQTMADNRSWIATRPIFGDDPVDVYVAKYRGNPMLFLRAEETNSCVRISSAVNPDTGERFVNPKNVCKALGLQADTVGHLSVRDNIITVHIDAEFIKPSAK